MKVVRRYNQYRRDLTIDMKCENCGAEHTYKEAYDDGNFWANVVPSFKCEQRGKSSNDLGISVEHMPTKYPEGMEV